MCPTRWSEDVLRKWDTGSMKAENGLCDKEDMREKGCGGAAAAWEQKQGAENRDLYSLLLFIPVRCRLSKSCLITPSVFPCLLFLFSSSNNCFFLSTYTHTHTLWKVCCNSDKTRLPVSQRRRGFVKHHAWAAMWKCLVFHSFSLNLPPLHPPWFGNIITSEINTLPGCHD